MHQTTGTDADQRRSSALRVASGVLFAVAILGMLFLPWDHAGITGLDMLLGISWSDMVRHPDWPDLVGLAVLWAGPVVGLALSFRTTRRAAVARAILAATGTAWFALWMLLSFGLTGRPPDTITWYVGSLALLGALVANVLAAGAGRRPSSGREGPNARTSPGIQAP